MGWFRSSRRGAAWLALVALACQLAMSFAHVHLGRPSTGSIAWAGAASGDIAPSRRQSPQKDPTRPGDFCAICANIALAGMLAVPETPVALVRTSFTQVSLWPQAATAPASFEHFIFEARAPPPA
jgi:hypothetical protein